MDILQSLLRPNVTQKDIIQNAMQEKAQKTYVQLFKSKDFFLTQKNFKTFEQQYKLNIIDPSKINSIVLECSGHGSFQKQKVIQRFLSYLRQSLKKIRDLKKIKVKLSGLQLNQVVSLDQNKMKQLKSKKYIYQVQQKLSVVSQLVDEINNRISDLNSIEIRITNVENCRIEDFTSILTLGFSVSAKTLTNLSLQFSDWSFLYEKKQRDQQPSLQQLRTAFQSAFAQGTMGSSLPIKKFRLQISTWYYTQEQHKGFFADTQPTAFENKSLNGKKVTSLQQFFHYQITNLMESIMLTYMPFLTSMQLDFRNWHKKFDMGQLKSSIANINNQSKQSTYSSLSKRVGSKNYALSLLAKSLEQTNKKGEGQSKAESFDLIIVV